MKEITSTAFNFLAQLHEDGPPTPDVEVALILSEVNYRLGVGSDMVRERTAETVRFTAPPAVLRQLAKQFMDRADECETYLSESLREHADKEVADAFERFACKSGVATVSAPPTP